MPTCTLVVGGMLAGLGNSVINLGHLPWVEQLVGSSAGNELGGLGNIVTSCGGVIGNEVTAADDGQLGTNRLGFARNGKRGEVGVALESSRLEVCSGARCGARFVARASADDDTDSGDGELGVLCSDDDAVEESGNLQKLMTRATSCFTDRPSDHRGAGASLRAHAAPA